MNFCNSGHCTCFPDTVLGIRHSACCRLHDFNYEKQHISRWTADKRFFKCLKKHTFFLLAILMWSGVRAFGWFWWMKSKRSKKKMSKKVSNAILHEDELKEHFSDEANHHLYKKRDDNTLVCWMCCDFEVVRTIDGAGVIDRGGCGDGIVYDLNKKTITIEKGN
jgi:hypothetical protein